MPSYYARSTAIQLSTAPLATTSSTSASTVQSHETTSTIQSINVAFSKASLSHTLNEEPIQDAESGSHLLFLGKDKNVPFIMVHAGTQVAPSLGNRQVRGSGLRQTARPRRVINAEKALESAVDQDVIAHTSRTPTVTSGAKKEMNTRRSSRHRQTVATSSKSNESIMSGPAPDLEALSLNVLLSPQSFLAAAPSSAPNKKRDIQDLQIIVYVNGTFANSFFVSARYAFKEFLTTKLSLRLTGNRLGRLVEKPWVLGPPQTQQSIQSDDSGLQRWSEISQLLLKEVDFIGKSKTGDSPISGELLSHLASMPCPDPVKGLGKFGCMDVLIMTGKGGKHVVGSRYSTGPERMTDQDFRPHVRDNLETSLTLGSAASSSGLQDANADNASDGGNTSDHWNDHSLHNLRKRPHTPDLIADDGQLPETPTHTTSPVSYATARTQVSDLHQDLDKLNLCENAAASRRSSTQSKIGGLQTAFWSSEFTDTEVGSASKDLVSRRQLPQTPTGEISPLSSLATEDLDALAVESAAANGSDQARVSMGILQSSPEPPSKSRLRPSFTGNLSSVQTRSGRQLLKLRPPKPPAEATSQTPQPASAGTSTEKRTSLRKTPSANALRGHESAISSSNSNKLSHRPKSKIPLTPLVLSTPTTPSTPADEHFREPAASQDCVLGFAPAGVIRSVPARRGGWFQETGVVYGCRFILS